jgi:hypothetical protein
MSIESPAELTHAQQRIAELQRTIASARTRLAAAPRGSLHAVALQDKQLEQLQGEVREYLGLSPTPSAAIEFAFETRDRSTEGTATLKMLEDAVGALRGALTNIAVNLVEGRPRLRGRPPERVARAVDFRVVGIGRGSFRLLMEYPVSTTDTEGEQDYDLADRTISILEDAAKWVDSESSSPPPSLADDNLRNVALTEVKRLAPGPGSGMSWLELRRTGGVRLPPVRFTATTATRVNRIIESRLTEETLSLTGQLRAIDLDNLDFHLTDKAGQRHPCRFEEGLLSEALGYIVSQQPVVVRGVRKGRTLHVFVLEPSRNAELTS